MISSGRRGCPCCTQWRAALTRKDLTAHPTSREVRDELLISRVMAVHPIIDAVGDRSTICVVAVLGFTGLCGTHAQCVLVIYFDKYVSTSIYNNQQMFRNDFGDNRT